MPPENRGWRLEPISCLQRHAGNMLRVIDLIVGPQTRATLARRRLSNRTRIGRHAGFHFAAIELVRLAYRRARQYQPEAVL